MQVKEVSLQDKPLAVALEAFHRFQIWVCGRRTQKPDVRRRGFGFRIAKWISSSCLFDCLRPQHQYIGFQGATLANLSAYRVRMQLGILFCALEDDIAALDVAPDVLIVLFRAWTEPFDSITCRFT